MSEIDHDKTDDAVWDNFSKKLTSYLDTVTLGSLIDETKSKPEDIDLEELTNYYQQN